MRIMYKRMKLKVTSLQKASRIFYKSMYEKGQQQAICTDAEYKQKMWEQFLNEMHDKKEISTDAAQRWKTSKI